MIPKEETLEKMLHSLDQKSIKRENVYEHNESESLKIRYDTTLGPNDALTIPNIYFKITHRFKELENKRLTNKKLKSFRFHSITDTIDFKLDKNGAVLKLINVLNLTACGPTYYIVNSPFLVVWRDRKSKYPYSVMWVDNDELSIKE